MAADEVSVETPERAPTKAPSIAIWTYAGMAAVAACVGIAIAFVLLWLQLVDGGNSKALELAQNQIAKTYVGYFNSRISSLQGDITALANSSAVRAALQAQSSEDRKAAAQALRQQLPYARRLEILPRGTAEVDLSADVPITFAALDVIKKAETRPFVGPEASMSQRQLMYLATPVTHQGRVAGVLFIALDHRYFLDPLEAFDEQDGEVSIEQKFEGTESNNVLQWGARSSREESVRQPLKVEHWALVFKANPASTPVPFSTTDLLMPLLACLAVMLGGVFIAMSNFARKLNTDLNTLEEYALKRVRGRTPALTRYAIARIQQIAVGMSKGGSAPEPQNPTASREASKTEADEVPDSDPALTDDLLQAAEEETEENFLDVADSDDDDNEDFGIEVSEEAASPSNLGIEFDPNIFRAYDIRGITTTNLTEDVVYWIGRAFAAEAQDYQQERVSVGRDGRNSSEGLRDALVRGLTEGGVDVVDIGMTPTPLLYYSNFELGTNTGIMITGSHNPPEYNGLKMVLAGETLAEGRIQELHRRLTENRLTEGSGDVEHTALMDHYVDRVTSDVVVAQALRVVVDCGNGVAGAIAPRLIEELGCEVIPLYCDVDGNFPNHHPDPAEPHNLEDLITVVKSEGADLGLAFDGDGDRLGLVTNRGEIIWPDKMMMLFAQDVVGRNPGADIIYDVKCSRHLNTLISEYGGRPIMWKTGHSHIKAKIKETGALLAGEFSGHICFGERWYGFDDALYTAARLLEIVGGESKSVGELFDQFPVTFTTPELKINTSEERKFEVMQQLAEQADFGDGTLTSIDGVRVDYADGWGLIRPSNTSPVLSLRFEADGQASLDRIQDVFEEQLSAIDSSLKFR